MIALMGLTAVPAAAQDYGRGDRGRDRAEQSQDGRGGREEPQRRRISEAEAQRTAQARAGGARYVGYLGERGGRHVFRFERDGRVMDIAVDAYR